MQVAADYNNVTIDNSSIVQQVTFTCPTGQEQVLSNCQQQMTSNCAVRFTAVTSLATAPQTELNLGYKSSICI
jgi:hypothetical protein